MNSDVEECGDVINVVLTPPSPGIVLTPSPHSDSEDGDRMQKRSWSEFH